MKSLESLQNFAKKASNPYLHSLSQHACLQVRDKFNQAPFFDMKNLFFMKD